MTDGALTDGNRFVIAAAIPPGHLDRGAVQQMGAPWVLYSGKAHRPDILVWAMTTERLTMAEVGRINLDLIALMSLVPCLPLRLTDPLSLTALEARWQTLGDGLSSLAETAKYLAGSAQMEILLDRPMSEDMEEIPEIDGRDYLRNLHDKLHRPVSQQETAALAEMVDRLTPHARAHTEGKDANWSHLFLIDTGLITSFRDYVQSEAQRLRALDLKVRLIGPFVPLRFAQEGAVSESAKNAPKEGEIRAR